MLRLWTYLQAQMVRDEAGATMVEYGIMIALIAVVSIAAVIVIGTQVNLSFEDVGTKLGG